MSEPNVGDIAADLSKISKGLTALQKVWSFAGGVAALQERHRGEAIPLGELFGAMFGFGEKGNPLAQVEQQLAEINAKLDRVLAGIEELKVGQLGQGVLAAYLDMSDPAYLIEKYFQDLAAYTEAGQAFTGADRKEFVEKLLGKRSERDSVAFCAHKLVKLGPTQSPLFFELLFPYLAAAATPDNAREIYLKGAYAFRGVAELLSKGLILETFAAASTGEDAARVAAKAEKVTEKYRGWMRAMAENSFLPFAERLATFYFNDEYLGGHDTSYDANLNRAGWKPATPSILQSADELAAKLVGKTRSVTLRVLANVPPIADVVAAARPKDVITSGRYEWRAMKRPETSLTRDNILDKLEPGGRHSFLILRADGKATCQAESVRKVEVPFAKVPPPPGFPNDRISFLRYQFDLGALPDGAEFQFVNDERAKREFPILETLWHKLSIEDGKASLSEIRKIQYNLLTGTNFPGWFKLPPEGQLSPVLVTYAYDRFGPA